MTNAHLRPSMAKNQKKSFDYCIYCGTTSGKLSNEHAIPDAISGDIVLLRASCTKCQRIINSFEQRFLHNSLELFRSHVNFKRSRKSKRERRSPYVAGKPVSTNDVLIPLLLIYPRHLPWIEKGKIEEFQDSPDALFCAAVTSWQSPNPDIPPNFKVDDQYRAIAKMAYALSVYNFELPFRSSPITDFILGASSDFREFFGASLEGGRADRLHSWSYEIIRTGRLGVQPERTFLRIKLTIFSSAIDITFHVVTRDITSEMPHIESKFNFSKPTANIMKEKPRRPLKPFGMTIVPGQPLPYSEKLSFEYKKRDPQ